METIVAVAAARPAPAGFVSDEKQPQAVRHHKSAERSRSDRDQHKANKKAALNKREVFIVIARTVRDQFESASKRRRQHLRRAKREHCLQSIHQF